MSVIKVEPNTLSSDNADVIVKYTCNDSVCDFKKAKFELANSVELRAHKMVEIADVCMAQIEKYPHAHDIAGFQIRRNGYTFVHLEREGATHIGIIEYKKHASIVLK